MTDWHPRTAADLPDGLVLFDGICVMCSAWVSFLVPRDPQGRYRFVPIQSELGRELAARFGIDPDMPQSNLVVHDGQAWFKADSALAVGRNLPGWRWTRLFGLLPRVVRNAAYDLVAGNRYRLFGRDPVCPVPPEGVRDRIVTTRDGLA